MGSIFEKLDEKDIKDLQKESELVLFLGETQTVHGYFQKNEGDYIMLERALDIPVKIEIPFLDENQIEVVAFLRKLYKPFSVREKEMGYNKKVWDVYRINL